MYAYSTKVYITCCLQLFFFTELTQLLVIACKHILNLPQQADIAGTDSGENDPAVSQQLCPST